MATGPGPGSHLIGGAHVRLGLDDRLYHAKLAAARAAMAQFAASLGGLISANFRPLQQGLVNLTNRWWLMNQAVVRTAQSLNQATAAQIRFNTVANAQGASSAAQNIRAQAYAQAQLIRANAYAASQAALAAQRVARTPGGVPTPIGPSVTLGDRLAFGGQDLLRGLAATVRQTGKQIGAFGQAGVRSFAAVSAALDNLNGSPGIGRGFVTAIRGMSRGVSRFGVNLERGFYDVSRQLLSFDFRGGISGRIATGLQGLARGLADVGDRAISGLQSAGIFRLSPIIDRFFGSISDSLFGMGVQFWAISRNIQGPWRRMASISAGLGNRIGQVTQAVSTFGERMAIGLRFITQRLPSPWLALSRVSSAVGSSIGSFSTFIQVGFTRLSAGIRGASLQFGKIAPQVLNAVGGLIGNIASVFTKGLPLVVSLINPIVGTAMTVFGAVMKTAFGVFGSAIQGIAKTISKSIFAVLGSIGQVGVLAGGIGAAFSLVYITNQIVKMEHELTRLRRTTGASAQEIQALAASFNDMGTTLAGVDLNKIIELATMGARLGVPREQLNLFTRDLAKVAAVLEDIPIDEATQRFSGLIDVFQLAYTDTIRLASSLNALDIASNASGRDILDIAGRMSGAAATIGLTVQQTLALATAMRQARVPIETAGTAMSQILGRMTSKDMPAFARVAGMSGAAFRNLLQRDALQALVAVEQGLGRLGGIERFRALDELHLDGQRVRLVMLQLVPVLGRLTQYLGIANDEWTSTNSIMQGFRMQAETASAMFKRMWNNVQLLAVSMGTFLLPIIKGLADGIGNLSADIREFIMGNAQGLEAWGKRVGQMFEGMGAIARVNWRDIGEIVRAAWRDITSQIVDRGVQLWTNFVNLASWAWTNIGRIALNAFNNFRAMAVAALAAVLPMLQNMITNAILAVARAVAASLGAGIRALLGIDMKKLAAIPAAIMRPPAMVPWLQGVGPRPGMAVPGLNMPPGLGMIAGIFDAGAAAQRGERNRREAAGALGDILVRFLGRLRGKGGAQDKALGRLIGMANLEDQAGAGGAGGGLGVGGGGGVIPNGGALGMAGAFGGLGGIAERQGIGRPAIPPRPGPPNPWVQRLRLMGNAPGMAGMAAWVGARFAVDSPHERHMQLLAWRQRMAARGQDAVNPWGAIRRNLMAARQAQFMALGGGRVLAARNRRVQALRRLEAARRARMGPGGVAGQIRDIFGHAAAGIPFPMGQAMAANLLRDPRRNWVMDMMPRERDLMGGMMGGGPLRGVIPQNLGARVPENPLVGIQEWGDSWIGRLVDKLEEVRRAIGTPVFGD